MEPNDRWILILAGIVVLVMAGATVASVGTWWGILGGLGLVGTGLYILSEGLING